MQKWPILFAGSSFVFVALGQTGAFEHFKLWKWLDTMIDPAIALYFLAGICFLAGLALHVRDWEQSRVRHFDISLQEAIDYLVRRSPHSFNSDALVKRDRFKQLYKEMCSGRLLVAGSEKEAMPTKRIRSKRCKELTPREVVIPRNPTAPNGIRYDLIDESAILPLVEYSESVGFTDLRVRSKDLYRLWPQNRNSGE